VFSTFLWPDELSGTLDGLQLLQNHVHGTVMVNSRFKIARNIAEILQCRGRSFGLFIMLFTTSLLELESGLYTNLDEHARKLAALNVCS
jgi:hypothetical protein